MNATRRMCSVGVSAFCALLSACSGAGADAEEPTGESFLAVAADFRGYRSWLAFDVSAEAESVGIHDGSSVTVYLSAPPPSGASEFPLGTRLVKEALGGSMPHELFAMARRGGNFNSTGARGWEWFELENLEDGNDSVKINWRGFGPPLGEMYGGDPNSGCNSCHKACVDAVCSAPLNLSNF